MSSIPPKEHTLSADRRYLWLDLLRGLSGLAVFAGHLRTLTFKNYAHHDPSFIRGTFFYVTGFGHQAVVIFFVLSGFFISKNVVNSVARSRWTIQGYAIDRGVRLWIVLIPALLLTLFVDKLGLHFFHNSLGYQGKIPFLGGVDPLHKSGFVNFLGNSVFIQTIWVPTFGSNAALWSLSNEFWYYLLFPLLYFSFTTPRFRLKGVLLGCAGILLYFVGPGIASYFSIWLMGFCVVLAAEKIPVLTQKTPEPALFLSLLLFLTMLHFIRLNVFSHRANDFTLGVATALLLLNLSHQTMTNQMLRRLSIFFSEISFSLYVIHLPLCLFLSAWVFSNPIECTLRSFMVYCMLFMSILGITFLFWYVFESRYKTVRGLLREKLIPV